MGLLTQGQYHLSDSKEIGEGGIRIVSPYALNKGQRIVLTFFVGPKRFITVTGSVVYAAPIALKGEAAYGVKFENLVFEGRRMIRDYIAMKTAEEVKL